MTHRVTQAKAKLKEFRDKAASEYIRQVRDEAKTNDGKLRYMRALDHLPADFVYYEKDC